MGNGKGKRSFRDIVDVVGYYMENRKQNRDACSTHKYNLKESLDSELL
jgi:hypothetical protein